MYPTIKTIIGTNSFIIVIGKYNPEFRCESTRSQREYTKETIYTLKAALDTGARMLNGNGQFQNSSFTMPINIIIRSKYSIELKKDTIST